MNTTERQEPIDGQVAIITGAAQGIGLTTAELLAERGATVVMVDIDGDRLNAAAAELSGRDLNVVPQVLDLTDQDQVKAMVDATIRQQGRIDALVNLAAIYPFIPIEDVTLEVWRKIQEVNVDGTFICTQAVLPYMRERKYGRIVNTSSGTFQRPEPGLSAYVTSKGAIVGFTRQLACEAGEGITVNVVMPGLITTEHTISMLDEAGPGMADALFERMVGYQAVKRRGEPFDVAQCIAYIVGPETSFITGQIFDVGGGVTFS
jgi:NAD(P)-dependent dehydrogenase (short-subunit alcohol dehydrogenase family)